VSAGTLFSRCGPADLPAFGGVPRKINILATNALLVGYGRDEAWIDASLVEELREERACTDGAPVERCQPFIR